MYNNTMVGYHQGDELPMNQKLLAGTISGIVTRSATQPLDVLKIRAQLQRQIIYKKPPSTLELARKIYIEEGITAFWHGHNIGQLHSILAVTTQFYVYELTTKYTYKVVPDDKYKFIVKFFCGLCSGTCTYTVITPLEVIRVRQMLIKEQYKGLYHGAKAVYKTGGLLAFYEGWFAGVLMMGPQMGITFTLFSIIQPYVLKSTYKCNGNCISPIANDHDPTHLAVASTVAAGVSGLIGKVVMYPLDLTRRRLQIASHRSSNKFFTPSTSRHLFKCRRLMQCIADSYKSEGIRGLYRGLEVTLYKSQLFNIITFTTYELLCYFIRKLK